MDEDALEDQDSDRESTSPEYDGQHYEFRQSLNSTGDYNYYQDGNGSIVMKNSHLQCNYCLVTSRSSEACGYRRADIADGIYREVHPDRGLIHSIRRRR